MQKSGHFDFKKLIAKINAAARKCRGAAAGFLKEQTCRAKFCKLCVKISAAARKWRETAAKYPQELLRRARSFEKEQQVQMIRRAVAVTVMAAVTVASVATAAAATKYASVTVDNQPEKVVEIASPETQEILKRAGVTVKADDLVARTDNTDKANTGKDVLIMVRTAKHVTVTADGNPKKVAAHYGDTVADALRLANITLGANDLVTPPLASPAQDGMAVTVKRRYNITITADGSACRVLASEGTVADALKQAGVTIGTEDFAQPGPGTVLKEGMAITISRVTYKDVTATQPIAYETVTEKDDSIDAGTQSEKTAGQAGVKTTVTRQKLCDGKVVQSTVVKSEVTKQPVNRVVVVGTKSLGSGYASVCADGTVIDENGKTVSYRKLYSGRCTCYCSGTTTASGLPAAYGRVAVNPDIIPYGTRLYICSPDGSLVYGYAVAADTGGAAMSGRIVADLYYPSYSQCMGIGTRTMNVYVLN